MKKILIFLVITLLIATTFVTVANAKINKKNKFITSNRDGPFLDKIINFLKRIPFINKTINFLKNLFGLAEEIEDINPPEDFDREYDVYFQDPDTEPGSEKPTDKTLSVNIKNFDLDYSDKGDYLEFDLNFDGFTSGDVYACYYIMVNYYEDGSSDYANLWIGPMKQSELGMADYSFELTFEGTGPEGNNDWSSFKARQYFSGVVNLNDIPFEIPEENQKKTLEDVRLYVRAFSDKELTQWNQDSISIMNEMTETVYEEPDEDDSGIPGFEIFLLIVAFAIALIIWRKNK